MRPSYSADTLTCAIPDCPGMAFLLAENFSKNSLRKVLQEIKKDLPSGIIKRESKKEYHEKRSKKD